MQGKSSTNIKMIDVSKWQGDVDWSKVKAAGISAAYAKSSEGVTFTDPTFAQNVKNAKAAGIPIGAYHFARPENNDATAEAKHFVSLLKQYPTDLMPVLDLESPTNSDSLTGNDLATWARTFIDYVQHATGRKVMLYTGNWYVNQYGITGLSDVPLWVANYANISAPPNCGGWTRWTAWQYTENGSVAGVSGKCDISVAESIEALKGVKTVLIQQGDQGSEVKDLQVRLNAQGFPCGKVDGVFGNATLEAVKAFQKAQKLTVDGIVGDQTWARVLNPVYDPIKVELNGKPYHDGIDVNDYVYVISTALDVLNTPHTYKLNGLFTINGKDVQGVVYKGDPYVPWKQIASIVQAQKINGGWNFVVPQPAPKPAQPAPKPAPKPAPAPQPAKPAEPAKPVQPTPQPQKPVQNDPVKSPVSVQNGGGNGITPEQNLENAINAIPEPQKIGLFEAIVNLLKKLFHIGGKN